MLKKTLKHYLKRNVMEAVEFVKKDKRFHLIQKQIPSIYDPNDVLIKVLFSGICEMDIHIIQSEVPCNKDTPFVLGHEICGVVIDVGDEVKTVSKKNKVVVDPFSDCGICSCCRTGKPHLCKEGCTKNTIGVFQDGGWAEYIRVHQKQVYIIPDTVTLEQAAITEPMTYVVHGWGQIAPIPVEKNILVVGAGLTGHLWIIMLHHHGHKNVTVVEPNLARHEFLQQLHIEYECISPKILSERHREDPEFLFDLILICTGSKVAIEQCFKILDHEGKMCIIRTPYPETKISIAPWHIHSKQITIIGIDIGSFCFPKTLDALAYLGEKYISFEHLGIKTYSLKEYKQAIDHVKKGSVLKAMFRLPDDCLCKYAGDK